MGMIGVDKIGEIRCAYFERHSPIEEIVPTIASPPGRLDLSSPREERPWQSQAGLVRMARRQMKLGLSMRQLVARVIDFDRLPHRAAVMMTRDGTTSNPSF